MTRLYLNLRETNLILDFSDKGGLWLLSQYFKKCNSTLCCSSSRALFLFWTMPSRLRDLVIVRRLRKKRGEIQLPYLWYRFEPLCMPASLRIPYSKRVRLDPFTSINQSWVHEWKCYELLVRELNVCLWQEKKKITARNGKVQNWATVFEQKTSTLSLIPVHAFGLVLLLNRWIMMLYYGLAYLAQVHKVPVSVCMRCMKCKKWSSSPIWKKKCETDNLLLNLTK